MKKMSFVLLLGLALTACGKKEATDTAGPINVSTERAQLGGYSAVPYTGTVEGEETLSLSFGATGQIISLTAEEGQLVHAGEVIGRIDEQSARNGYEAADAAYRTTEDAYRRMRPLHDSATVSQQKWVEMQNQLTEMRAARDIAKKMANDCVLRAPVTGVISRKKAAVGEQVAMGQPVYELVRNEHVKICVSIPEKEIGSYGTATKSLITVEALQGRTYQGGTLEKSIEADALTHTYIVRIPLANADRALMPGMLCNVVFEQPQARMDSCITLPVTAVCQNARGEQFVWVVKDEKAHRQPVEVGRYSGNRIEITQGLTVGQPVIVEGYQKVSEGTKVKG